MENTNLPIDQNKSLYIKIFQIPKDFCKWIRGHDNLYQCLIKIKNLILNDKILILYFILLYYLYKKDT